MGFDPKKFKDGVFSEKDLLGFDLGKLNPGIFSNKDCKVLFNTIQSRGIKNVLEIGGRTGRTTSVMVQANPNIKIDVFEKDEDYHDDLESISPNISVYGNVIDHPLDINKYDFIFIDGNHDYIFARWYVDQILDKCLTQLIHIHDMPLKDNDLESLDIIQCRIIHADIISVIRLKGIYGLKMYDKYQSGRKQIAELWEGDIVSQFIQDNDMRFCCTYDGNSDDEVKGVSPQIQNCSLYMERPF